MNKNILSTSIKDSVYFSCASFVIVWLAGFLYETLQKTTGQLNIAAVTIIVLSLVLIIFVLAIINIVLSEAEKARIRLWERIVAVIVFLVISAIILGVLALLFWVQF